MEHFSEVESKDSFECRNILGLYYCICIIIIHYYQYFGLLSLSLISSSISLIFIMILMFMIMIMIMIIMIDAFRKQTIKAYDIKQLLEERYAILSGKCFYMLPLYYIIYYIIFYMVTIVFCFNCFVWIDLLLSQAEETLEAGPSFSFLHVSQSISLISKI